MDVNVCVCVCGIFMCVWNGKTTPIHFCSMSNFCVSHGSYICATWLIYMRDVTHISVRYDLFICVTCMRTNACVCNMTHATQHTSYEHDAITRTSHATPHTSHEHDTLYHKSDKSVILVKFRKTRHTHHMNTTPCITSRTSPSFWSNSAKELYN